MITEKELIKVKQALTSIRTESISDDVWDKFVIPRFFDENELKSQHALRIEGSRGSGKTMLLKYLSYESQFSNNRKFIPIEAIEHIGIYWKADPQFLRTLNKRSVSEDEWSITFDNYVITKVAIEIIKSIFTISNSNYSKHELGNFKDFTFEGIKDYGFNSENISDVYKELESKLRKIEMSIMNIKGIKELEKLPPTFLIFIIHLLKDVNSNIKFYIYVDEYENLLSYQQRVINTKIKVSDDNIKFNVAIKKNGMSEYRTCSDEKLENVADYRIINLDEKIKDNDLEAYLAEILIKKLVDSSLEMKEFISEVFNYNSTILHKPDKLSERREKKYLKDLDSFVGKLLPKRSTDDLAEEVFNNAKFRNKMESEIVTALRNKGININPKLFVDTTYKKATIVCTSLLYRKTLNTKDILYEFEKLKKGESNKFNGKTDWIKNNFIGAYLRIISSYSKNSTFYSGFDIFCQLSSGNVRHFLELCRTCFGFLEANDLKDDLIISNVLQDIAARQTSETLVREVKQFTPYGSQLSRLVEGLGVLFQYYQQDPSQSEPEITQFSFANNVIIDSEINKIIAESEKWGILIIKDSTKEKSKFGTGMSEYILNPVYAPRFSISYRKGRKAILNLGEFKLLIDEGKGGAEKILKLKDKNIEMLQGTLEW